MQEDHENSLCEAHNEFEASQSKVMRLLKTNWQNFLVHKSWLKNLLLTEFSHLVLLLLGRFFF